MPFLSHLQDGRSLPAVYVNPGPPRTGLVCIHDQAVKLVITAPPVDVAATWRSLSFFKKDARQEIIIQKGHQSRRKQIVIGG